MALISPTLLFLLLPAFLGLFALAGRWSGRAALAVLVIASLLFAAAQDPSFLVLTIVSAIGNYAVLALLLRPGSSHRSRALLLAGGVTANMILLALCKYSVWLAPLPVIGNLAVALSAGISVTISFLTFQRSVALLDAYSQPDLVRRELETPTGGQAPRPALDRALRFFGFATMFPNLLIGPIAYLTEVAPQLRRGDFGRIRAINLSVGLMLLFTGLFKKVLIADPLGAQIVDPVFARLHGGGGVLPLDTVFAILAWFVQLYFDFSGYSDIVLGIARMFGVRLPINFNSPLRATGIIDFYRRWHITLTRVIARFLFSPLSIAGTRFAMRRKLRGARLKLISLWGPLLVNFLVIGLWHGPRATYLLFGALHGLWYVIETEVRGSARWKRHRKATSDRTRALAGAAITIPPLMLTFALFRAPNLADFGTMLGSLHGDWVRWFLAESGRVVKRPAIEVLAAAYALVYLPPNIYEIMHRYRPGIVGFKVAGTALVLKRLRWSPTLAWGLFAAALGLAVLDSISQPATFIYGVF